jgi:hypothetical protein
MVCEGEVESGREGRVFEQRMRVLRLDARMHPLYLPSS